MSDRYPFIYLAMREGYLGGMFVANVPPRELAKIMAKYVRDGYTIVATYSREDYEASIAGVPWASEAPWAKRKRRRT